MVSNPLLLPEIVASVIDNVDRAPDLLNCACVNHIWNVAALKKLYRGSVHDMRFRTPDTWSLNGLFVTSQKLFAQNMSFVRHLLLSPVYPKAIADEARYEKYRALHQHKYVEFFCQLQGRGLASLTIPFEISDQNWSLIFDLLLTPTIEYLAIDSYYCQVLMGSPSYAEELLTPANKDKFSNLKALTIYIFETHRKEEIDGLCQLLKHCDLQFFHLEELQPTYDRQTALTHSTTAKVLTCLQQHQNLKALVLSVGQNPQPWKSKRKGQGNPWPKLKALYLEVGSEDWLEQLPEPDELQILNLLSLDGIETIAKCRHLRSIEIASLTLDKFEALLEIAHGCPLLQKFSVERVCLGDDPDLGEDKLFDLGQDLLCNLLRALPRLEYLALDSRFQLDGAILLPDLARHCPRLTVLSMPRTRLWLSLATMTNINPLWQLETMSFAKIFFEDLQLDTISFANMYFEDPRPLLQSNDFNSLAAEWRRIFPRLRGMPCEDDAYRIYGVSSHESDEDPASWTDDEEMSVSEPGQDEPRLDFHKYKSDCSIIRTALWKFVGYDKDRAILHNIHYTWDTNLEIEVIGWPVVPLRAFAAPEQYYTAAG